MVRGLTCDERACGEQRSRMLKSCTPFTACACAWSSAGEAAAGSLAIASVARSACASIRQNKLSAGTSINWKWSGRAAVTEVAPVV